VPEPVLIVGAGPVGMATALELARHDVPSVILEAKPAHSEEGSRAIVLARHTLEEFARLGWSETMLRKGSVIARARTYFRTTELFCSRRTPSASCCGSSRRAVWSMCAGMRQSPG
jgi:2-polyprenyl-6-methoxyphenol hydroxylase-like FAD-dependent oxidoreductase